MGNLALRLKDNWDTREGYGGWGGLSTAWKSGSELSIIRRGSTSNGKLAIDAADGFALRDEQACQILCEVAAFWGIGEQVAIFGQEVLDDGRKRDDGRHTIPCSINQLEHCLADAVFFGELAVEQMTGIS